MTHFRPFSFLSHSSTGILVVFERLAKLAVSKKLVCAGDDESYSGLGQADWDFSVAVEANDALRAKGKLFLAISVSQGIVFPIEF